MPKGLDHSWSIDLLFFPQKQLRRLRIGCILCIVENLCHFLWARTLRNNRGDEVIRVLKDLLSTTGRQPTIILVDQGAEFQGYKFRQFCSEREIQLQTVFQAPNKVQYGSLICATCIVLPMFLQVCIAELHNRLLKTRIQRQLLTQSRSVGQFALRLERVVQALNQRGLKRLAWASPIGIDCWNQLFVIERLHLLAKQRKPDTRGIRVADLVRIQLRRIVSNTAAPRFSQEVYRVAERLDGANPVLFKLEDLEGTPIQQVWYGNPSS